MFSKYDLSETNLTPCRDGLSTRGIPRPLSQPPHLSQSPYPIPWAWGLFSGIRPSSPEPADMGSSVSPGDTPAHILTSPRHAGHTLFMALFLPHVGACPGFL